MSRTLNVVRMQLVNRQTYIWVPVMVLCGSLLISLAIYAIISGAGVDAEMFGGGAQAPLWYFAVVGTQALSFTFPFSQAMSVTRREFFVGTLLTAVLTSALLAVIFIGGGLLEQATNGWWMRGYFFYIPGVWDAGPLAAGLFFTLAMLFFVAGFWGATIFKRWGTVALTATMIAIAVVLVGALWLVGRFDAWASVGTWIATMGSVGMSLWGLVLVVVLAGTSFLTLRRAVP